MVTEQQAIVDTFLELGLIPEAIKVSDAVWQSSQVGVSANELKKPTKVGLNSVKPNLHN
jgi:hypothetical protein